MPLPFGIHSSPSLLRQREYLSNLEKPNLVSPDIHRLLRISKWLAFPASPSSSQNKKGLKRMSREQILAAIDDEISKLQQVRTLLQGSGNKLSSRFSAGAKPRAKRVLSQEARQRIAAAQKRRWAKQKKEAAAK
ncbi:MAG TPA: hypothetical protein VFW25_09015 [Silvibacterium sp.]|nr:hypothetical protein [Silvibacterium sp.]